jgi:uncharacterized membrane protein YuzA (DUF378 family)
VPLWDFGPQMVTALRVFRTNATKAHYALVGLAGETPLAAGKLLREDQPPTPSLIAPTSTP